MLERSGEGDLSLACLTFSAVATAKWSWLPLAMSGGKDNGERNVRGSRVHGSVACSCCSIAARAKARRSFVATTLSSLSLRE